MTSFEETPAIVSLKDSGYPKILDHLEKGASAETTILSPDHFLEIDTILGNADVGTAATTSLVVNIIRTTKLLENAVSCEDLDAATRALAVLQFQKQIRAIALHLLPDDFTDTIALATKRVGEKIDRPVRTLKRKKAMIDHTCICLRCGGYRHTFRKCPDYVCCVCSELGPDHLSVHCPQLNGEIQLQEFRDDEKFFETRRLGEEPRRARSTHCSEPTTTFADPSLPHHDTRTLLHSHRGEE
ncbi:uncharacterized protein F5891DRAFT_1198768 [Suillus fuscotomentosus]|uniref:Uncharacterized protein n=1 Tax=Suillus fuscotomentosus TaxID=1912939 RepID=A0AAD4DQ41_9AGAM|nr:uncharacterized protein F5891DRAFT_1198768 [Suillus fuscotomentosus]KAG1889069.1 hypothetical protein F5891DRAFT_1198768 [Suillus fuscotomentosus]